MSHSSLKQTLANMGPSYASIGHFIDDQINSGELKSILVGRTRGMVLILDDCITTVIVRHNSGGSFSLTFRTNEGHRSVHNIRC